MATFIICVILIVFAFLALRSTRRKMRSGCCGVNEKPVKKINVRDRNSAHYPHVEHMRIDGMTCQNCVTHIENALNSLDGVFAKVSLDKKEATVRMRQQLPERVLRRAVSGAGYTVMAITRNE
ncbi:cation transporter [Sporolactobacillus nakayamae]|uniref:Copper chaperone CopZ n=1 Tax=Sporolactobacillus nakayamae TaxID=269670 RepID=A0A1I2MSA3_9BACL|nr:cation transporter [Sporolactobacillus nakayamae]SFF93579.1 Copper chaperone CopZ [Sporolactobacillus nakayamae]